MNTDVALPDKKNTEILVYGEDATKGNIMFDLSQRIPSNEYGLPQFIFRSDMLHGTTLCEDDIDAATLELYYFEGYPQLANGTTFWNQLPHEPQTHFELFQKYLDQAEEIGIRQLDMLGVATGKQTEELLDISHEFFWSARARAYDLFIVAAEAKKRQMRIRKMENDHYDQSGKLLSKLKERFEGDDEDWIDELTAKEAVEIMVELAKLQRMSVGLTGQHASSTARNIEPGESPEAIIRKLAQSQGGSNNQSESLQARLQSLLDNPEEGATIQAAILKITAPNNASSFSEDI